MTQYPFTNNSANTVSKKKKKRKREVKCLSQMQAGESRGRGKGSRGHGFIEDIGDRKCLWVSIVYIVRLKPNHEQVCNHGV